MSKEKGMADKVYGIGILGNCCTHGAGLAHAFISHPRTRIVTGCEADARRGPELALAMDAALADSCEAAVARDDVDIVCITADPCDKARMVELACKAGKPVLLNKPMCASLDDARRIEAAVAEAGVTCVLDIPMVKGEAAFAKLRAEMAAGAYGPVVAYHHNFGMTFPMDFPIRERWPERFDPPGVSGGGEMTNMGCYAIDYMVTLLGAPQSVQAKRQSFWPEYAASPVENFGQIVCDYGAFYATLAVGKQKLGRPHKHTNDLSIRFHNTNLLLAPYADASIVNGAAAALSDYVGAFAAESSIDQLIRSMETGAPSHDNMTLARLGVEVLMAAYRSIVDGGVPVSLPLADGANPLMLD
jgi:predicted dehydrogenase